MFEFFHTNWKKENEQKGKSMETLSRQDQTIVIRKKTHIDE